MAQVVKHQSSKCEAPSSNSSTAWRRGRRGRKRGGGGRNSHLIPVYHDIFSLSPCALQRGLWRCSRSSGSTTGSSDQVNTCSGKAQQKEAWPKWAPATTQATTTGSFSWKSEQKVLSKNSSPSHIPTECCLIYTNSLLWNLGVQSFTNFKKKIMASTFSLLLLEATQVSYSVMVQCECSWMAGLQAGLGFPHPHWSEICVGSLKTGLGRWNTYLCCTITWPTGDTHPLYCQKLATSRCKRDVEIMTLD
jgi:hypothetical protein